jgi:hypothetical protein
VQADPIGIKEGDNHLYIYVNNTPLMKKDTTGLFSGSIHGGVCGNASSTWQFGGIQLSVPDNPNVIFLFTVPCAKHDACYGCEGAGQGKSKWQCDKDFLQDMKNICKPFMVIPIVWGNCINNAHTYFFAVVLGGGSAFKNARKDCPSCSK